MNTPERFSEYRVSERSVLRPGTKFRASGGPLVKLSDGSEVSIAARGPFTFRAYCKLQSCEWIEAGDRDGCNAILHIGGRREKLDAAFVTRPYKIKSVIRKKGRDRCK